MKRFKRYMVWRSIEFYPSGGLEDFEASFDTEEEARAWIRSEKITDGRCKSWYGIFDRIEGVEIDLEAR